jgi:hypothetical protein
MGMDELRNREYNGWENRWTWLVHLHLSNEQALSNEMAWLIAGESDDAHAGGLVERWVKGAVGNWMNRFSGRNRSHDEQLGLLVWDLLGAALAYAEWDDLVTLLSGGKKVTNMFTAILHHYIRQSPQVRAHVAAVVRQVPSLVAAADALKMWFEVVLADWIDQMAMGRRVDESVTPLFSDLLHNVYGLVVWEHVARAFRPEY